MKKILSLFIFSFLTISCFSGTGILKGKISDVSTGTVLDSVKLTLNGSKLSLVSARNGVYSFNGIPEGIYTLSVSSPGYETTTVTGVNIIPGKIKNLDISLERISSNKEQDQAFLAEKRKMEILEGVSNQASAMLATLAGRSRTGISGAFLGRSGSPENEFIPNSNTEKYAAINENRMLSAQENNFSTFSADVDRAAYSTIRRFINQNQIPDAGAIRIEEMINYFPYAYPAPKDEKPFSITTEYASCPWNTEHNLVLIGIQGRKITEVKPNNLVFLLDVSGSMNAHDKLPLVQMSMNMLLENLAPKDRIAIVVYAGAAGLVLPSTPVSEKETIREAIKSLRAGGSTAGGEGVKLAYEVAEKNFLKNGNNRIILATDGDFNVGISSTSELTKYIESKRKSGIFLTALGFGDGNYRDELLQELADKGNGNHGYIDNILEAKKILIDEMQSTLVTIAKDVKFQVEFNPAKVDSFRLVGYENRMLNKEDFKDDKKDAGEVGSGHEVTAIYEIFPVKGKQNQPSDSKYVQTEIKKSAFTTNELLTVKIRYKNPDDSVSQEIASILMDDRADMEKASETFRFVSSVAEFGLILRDSANKGKANLSSVYSRGTLASGSDKNGYRKEFLTLVEKYKLMKNSRLEGRR
ncbi:MAG: von Willebrand factor type A domain-containing protein [Bacteroidetes bacterium]|nr:von Willebrand factor type A domain-containing protein [Bacteroidota bacterium]